ncbi:minor tail protein [Streptomyces phage Shawty]|uniref:Minor tail protein n=1 Tax=Streptomyces phage Shawty TaxID=2510521 RepID=A0A411CYF7_9CAUD|nr:minor tail protein [Streptomyces phage Shawty]
MAINANAMNPSLVNELNDMKRRLAALERKPDVLAKYDRYPTNEWAATGRGKVSGNAWSSCGIANVTGLVYDRVEVKFITNKIITGKREAEVRLAAFKHYGNNIKECVSTSDYVRLHGSSSARVDTFVMRWIHGIPFGWDYEDGASVYTIELQHRYLVGPDTASQEYFAAPIKRNATSDTGLTGLRGDFNGQNDWYQLIYRAGDGWGWQRRPIGDDGSYDISAFHYCVGLPESVIPEAHPRGWGWTSMENTSDGGAGNIDDPWVG